MKKWLVLAVAAVTFIATPAMAKEGFYLGAYLLPSVTISGDAGTGIDSGSGYGFRAGLGFNRYFSIEGTYSKTKHDLSGGSTADLTGLAADLKLNFPLTSLDSAQVMTLEPYVLLGYSINYELKSPSGSSSGNGARFGIGIELYLFRELSVNAGWTRTNLSFDSPINADGNIRTFDVGVIYHFI